MFFDVNDKEYLKAVYDRAQKSKPSMEGVRAHQLGWVVERNGYTEVLVSFRGLEDVVNAYEGSVSQEPIVEEVIVVEPEVVSEVEVVTEDKPKRGGRKPKVEAKEETTNVE